ncbi:archaetidylserine decarboxylase [Rhodopila sp.]|uniref:archaetidylserine decarboxylase n=1 Tax=Rhodopila sp. TaxID=2480087 RepID=UPI003D0D82A2
MKIVHQEEINFLLTNRIPRRLACRIIGWFSKIEQPLVRDISIGVWRFFSDLDLSDAKKTRFRSMHDCFTRQLRPGARPIEADQSMMISPCDAIVGAVGTVADGEVFQVKGFPYALADLLGDAEHAETFHGGCYVTLRLTSSMYHRFHAPHACHVGSVTHIPGDAWNVNPTALRRIERLYCKNERVAIRIALSDTGHPVTLVAVAAILVSGIRLRFLDLTSGRRGQPRTFACNAFLQKGEELGWFEHGSTIVVLAPAGFSLSGGVQLGRTIRMGQPLMQLAGRSSAHGVARSASH